MDNYLNQSLDRSKHMRSLRGRTPTTANALWRCAKTKIIIDHFRCVCLACIIHEATCGFSSYVFICSTCGEFMVNPEITDCLFDARVNSASHLTLSPSARGRPRFSGDWATCLALLTLGTEFSWIMQASLLWWPSIRIAWKPFLLSGKFFNAYKALEPNLHYSLRRKQLSRK